MNYEKNFHVVGNRRQLRERVVKEFLREECGTGVGDLACNYTYFVETLSDGRRLFLKRPAYKNKGFDFELNVENVDFDKGVKRRPRTRPSHDDILFDLENKKKENIEEYKKLYDLIRLVFECKELRQQDFDKIKFSTGYAVDLVLYVIKWMFIEQDIAYWNYTGRGRFMAAIPKPD
jgi:hypothetical protein